MAIPFLNHLDVSGNINLNDNKLNDFVVDHSTTSDAGTVTGKLIYDSGTLKYYDGSTWQSLGTSSGTMSSWVLEDGDGTEVSIGDAKEIKFIEGGGLDINWTDTSTGSDADPYDLTFTLDISGYSAVTPASGDSFLTLDSDGSTEQRTTVDALATLFAGSGLSASSGVLSVDTLNQDTTGTATNATNAAHVLVTDNESTNENNLITFVENGTSSTGNVGLEMDGNFHYNPSTGTVTATAFTGALTGNVTGNVSGTAATVTGAAQSNITSLGTLTTLTVDDITINGSTISDTGAFTLDVGGNITIDADGGTITFADGGSSLGTITSSGYSGNAATATLSSTVTVTDSNADTAFPVVLHNESNALLDDTGAFTYNPNSGTLSVANLVVSGTQTISNETVQVVENNTILFEGATDDANETKLTVVDPTADRTISLPNATGTVVLEDNSCTLTNKTIAISQVTELSNLTAAEGEQLENIGSTTISATQWGYVGNLDQDLTTSSNVSFAKITNTALVIGRDANNDIDFATAGEITFRLAGADQLQVKDGVILPVTDDDIDLGSSSKQFKNAYFDGTVEADAITVGGTALNTVIDNRIKVVQKTATVDVSSLVNNVDKCNIAHNMNSNNIIVKLYDSSTMEDVFADVDRVDANTLQIRFSDAPSNDIVVVMQEIIGDNIAAGSNITYPTS